MWSARHGHRVCVLSYGRFAILGGTLDGQHHLASCETLSFEEGHWVTASIPPMLESRTTFACAAVAGCVIVAGGDNRTSAEVYDEPRGRWLRLPCTLPYHETHGWLGSALL
jgi:hypothetical protein